MQQSMKCWNDVMAEIRAKNHQSIIVPDVEELKNDLYNKLFFIRDGQPVMVSYDDICNIIDANSIAVPDGD